MATTLPNTRFHRVLLAVGVGASIMAAEFFGEFLVRYALKTGWREPGIALASNSVAGAVGSLLVYKLLSFEAERQRLRRELNHQIRNALQPILYCTYKLDGVKKQVIEACYCWPSALLWCSATILLALSARAFACGTRSTASSTCRQVSAWTRSSF